MQTELNLSTQEIDVPDPFEDNVLSEAVNEFYRYGLYEDIVNETLRSLKIYE